MMVSTEEIYKPVPPTGCLWVATKVLIAFVLLLIFFLGLFAGIFVSTVASSLM
jgi:hypothetical protein